jgi:hypothetical protein
VRQADRLVGSQIIRQTGQTGQTSILGDRQRGREEGRQKHAGTNRYRQTGRQVDIQVAINAAGSRKAERVAGLQEARRRAGRKLCSAKADSGRQADGLGGRQAGSYAAGRQKEWQASSRFGRQAGRKVDRVAGRR